MWICCQCGNGPNVVGWCAHDRPRTEVNALTGGEEVRTECEHCCCGNCTAYCEFCLVVRAGACAAGRRVRFVCWLTCGFFLMQMGEAVVVVVPRKEEEGGRPGKRRTAVLRRGPVRRAMGGDLLARRRLISGSRRTMAPEAAHHRTRRERIRSGKLSILSSREEGSGGKVAGFLGLHSDFLRYRASDPGVIFCDAEGRTGGLIYTRVETQCSGFNVGVQDRRTLRCTLYLGTESLLLINVFPRTMIPLSIYGALLPIHLAELCISTAIYVGCSLKIAYLCTLGYSHSYLGTLGFLSIKNSVTRLHIKYRDRGKDWLSLYCPNGSIHYILMHMSCCNLTCRSRGENRLIPSHKLLESDRNDEAPS